MFGVTVTSLVGFLTAVIALGAGAVLLFRQVVGAYGDRLETYKERAAELGTEKDHLQQELATQTEELKHLRERPDWEGVLRLASEMSDRADQAAASRQGDILKRLDTAIAGHEHMAQERHDSQMEVAQAMLRALSRIMQDVRPERTQTS